MKVRELIDVLKNHDPEMRVVVRGYEAGYDDVGRTIEVKLCLNVHKEWYYGRHDYMCERFEGEEEHQQEVCVILQGEDND